MKFARREAVDLPEELNQTGPVLLSNLVGQVRVEDPGKNGENLIDVRHEVVGVLLEQEEKGTEEGPVFEWVVLQRERTI